MTKDYSNQNLRGQSFKGVDLRGADFRNADIRGSRFIETDLTGADFCGAKSGLQRRVWLLWLSICIFMAIVSGGFGALIGYISIALLAVSNFWICTIGLALIVIYCVLTFQKGTATSIGYMTAILAMVTAANVFGASRLLLGMAGASFAVAVATALLALVVASTVALAGVVTGALTGVLAGSVIVFSSGAIAEEVAAPRGIAAVVAGSFILFQFFITWRALRGDPKEAWVSRFAVAFASTAGTTFRKANLSKAQFKQAILKGADFREAILVQTSFRDAKRFNRARWGNTILENQSVRKLLTEQKPTNKSFKNCNLQGANLDGLELQDIDFSGANLSNASLQGTHLERANLAQSQAIGASFKDAYLTGACIEAWNIDGNTQLDNVNCNFIYLLEHPDPVNGSLERRPHNPDKNFEPGDFQKLYTKIMHTVQFLLRNSDDPKAFAAAFRNLMQKYPDMQLQSISRVDEDLLFSASVSSSTNKEEMVKRFDKMRLEHSSLKNQLKSAEERLKDREEIVKFLMSQPRILAGDKSFINTGEIYSSKIVNQSNIKGDTSNAVNQNPKYLSDIQSISIKLKTSIEAANSLNKHDRDILQKLVNKLAILIDSQE